MPRRKPVADTTPAPAAEPTTAAPTATKRVSFRLHPRVLWDIITRQSGTLDRAVLEGVQNSIDAGATEVALTCDGQTLTITDNGAGFTSEAEIERCFATFGAPQTADEKATKRFGYYRLGRGQLFAHGRNQWASATFRMDVDIRAQASDEHCDEIDFGLSTVTDAVPGCAITIQLYKPLLPSDLAALYRDVKQQVRYIEAVAITWNGERVSLDPSKGKWDLVTDEAYVRLTDSSTLALYNLGVLVKHFPDSRFGTGGIVVSRKQLKVNFARNDVMSDCPVWPHVMRAIDQRAKRRRRAVLTDAERKQIARQIGERSYDGVESVRKLKLITDVKNDLWSIEQIERWMAKHGVTKLAVCPEHWGERRHAGDRLMQYHLAFVVAQATLDAFGAETLDEWIASLAAYGAGHGLANAEQVPLDEAASLLRTDYRIIPESEHTPSERAALRLLAQARYTVTWPLQGRAVTFFLGQSDRADGWTDGRSYIVLHRKLVRDLGSVEAFHTLGHVLLHEVSHVVDGEGSQGEHVHNSTFYQTYHDGHTRLAHFVDACLTHWPRVLEAEGLALRKAALREQDRAAKLTRARAAFDAAVAETKRGEPTPPAPPKPQATRTARRRPIDAAGGVDPYYALLL